MTDWQPITTAPKDGTAILGYFPCRRGYIVRQDVVMIWWCGWGGGIWQNATSGHNIIGDGGGIWQNATSGHNIIGDEPTHWMAIPEAPAT